jgi:hypothetical protein
MRTVLSSPELYNVRASGLSTTQLMSPLWPCMHLHSTPHLMLPDVHAPIPLNQSWV